MRRKRVCLLINNLARGGAETQCARLALGLRERGYRVRVLTLLPSTAHTAELAEAGVPVVHVAAGTEGLSVSMITGLYRELRQFRPDVLISFLYHANLAGRLAGRMLAVPVVITSIRNEYFGGSDKPSDHPSVRLREQSIALTDRFASITTTNSEIASSSLIRREIVPRGRLRVIPNMVAEPAFDNGTEEIRTALRTGTDTDEGAFVWINVARLFRQKDHSTLLHAFAEHCKQHETSRLWIAGGGQLKDRLTEEARELGISHAVQFLEERSDVPRLLRAADAFVMSSQWEGLPNVLLEAGAAGLPVVSTAVGGVTECLPKDQQPFLVAAGDSASLADRMNRMREMGETYRRRLGAANRAHVRERFGQDAVLDQWIDLMEEMVGKKKRTGGAV